MLFIRRVLWALQDIWQLEEVGPLLKMLGRRSKLLLITTLGKSLINSDFISPHLASSSTSVQLT